MMIARSRPVLLALVFGFAALAACTSSVQAQTSLPENWQQLSAADFSSEIRNLQESGAFESLSPQEQRAAAQHAKDLFLAIDINDTDLSYHTIDMLHWVARDEFDESVNERTRAALLARQDDWTGADYPEVRGKVVMMMRLGMDQTLLITEARRWLAAGGTLAQVPDSDLSYDLVQKSLADAEAISGSFTVKWEGELVVPQTGNYGFYLSPIDVNVGAATDPVTVTVSASVNGTPVIARSPANNEELAKIRDDIAKGLATTDSYNMTEQPGGVLELTAGQNVPITVELAVEARERLPISRLHMILYWDGPGFDRQIIPAENFVQPSGDPGLQATYIWNVDGQTKTLQRVDADIDFVWSDDTVMLAKDTSIANSAADAMWQAMTDSAYINTLEHPTAAGQMHPFLGDPNLVASGMSSARRKQFLNLLLAHPQLLDPVEAPRAVSFYRAFRFGNPDEALEVFGTWATRHPNITCSLDQPSIWLFERLTRYAMADMALMTTHQHPGQITVLQDEYLELPDGSCSLPVAYTLACSYLGQRMLPDWIAFLDDKIDNLPAGDARVNWLLARAFAEELDPTSAVHYPFYFPIPSCNPSNGLPYLKQAMEAAQSPDAKLRAAKEIVARYCWARKFDQATQLITELEEGSLPAEQGAELASWQAEIDGFIAAKAQAEQESVAAAQQSYLDKIRERREKAANRGDSAAVERYDALIDRTDTDQ